MADAVLKIGAIVSTEQVKSGMTDSVEAVKAATSKIGVSFQELQSASTGAWKKISDDTRAAAGTVSAESLRIAESTKAVAAAHQELRAALSIARNANVDAATSTAVLAAAQDSARVKAMELVAAQEAVARATHHVVPEMAASSAAIRSLEGAVPIRAIERFVGTTLGLGPLLTAAFPIIGAVDLGIMLFRTGEELEAVRSKALKAGETIAEAFQTAHDKAQVTNDDLQIQDDKLKDEIAKLSGHPGTGLQTAIDEAIKRADQLLLSLRADRKELQALFKENTVGLGANFLSGVATTGAQEKQILADNKALTSAVEVANNDFADKVAADKSPAALKAAGERRATAIRGAFQTQIDAYKTESVRLRKEQTDSLADALASGEAAGSAPIVNNSAKISNVEGILQQLKTAQRRESLGEDIVGDQAKVGALKGEGGTSKQAALRLKAMEQELADQDLLRKRTLKEEFDFWEQRRDVFQRGSEQYLQVSQKMAAASQASSKAAGEEIKRAKAELKREALEDSAAQTAATKGQSEFEKEIVKQDEAVMRTAERWSEYWRGLARGEEIAAQMKETLAEGRIRMLEMTGQIDEEGAAHKRAEIHTEAHLRSLKALEEELAKLEQLAASSAKDPVTGALQDGRLAGQIGGVKNQISQEKGKGQAQGQQDVTAINAAVAKPYLKAFDQIDTSWRKVQNDLIAGNRNIRQSFAQMGLSLVQSLAGHFEKIVADHARMWIRMQAAHVVAKEQEVAINAVAASTSDAINKKSALSQIFADAKSAAAKAYKSMAGIPIVGPELGAVAAAATFGAVMSLAAFEKGGVVDGPAGMAVPILAHGGERVLTASQTNQFERVVNNNGGGGGEMHLHMGGNNFAGGGGDFHSQLRSSERQTIQTLRKWHREGKLSFAG